MFIGGSDNSKFRIVSFHPKHFVSLQKKNKNEKKVNKKELFKYNSTFLIGKTGFSLHRRLTLFQNMIF